MPFQYQGGQFRVATDPFTGQPIGPDGRPLPMDPMQPHALSFSPPRDYGPVGMPGGMGFDPGMVPDTSPQEQIPEDFWQRIAQAQGAGQQPFSFDVGVRPTGLEALLGGLAAFGNTKAALAGKGIADVEARNKRSREFASGLAKHRWEKSKFEQEQATKRAEAAANRGLRSDLAAAAGLRTDRGLEIRQQVADRPSPQSQRMVQVLAPDGSTVWMPSAQAAGQPVGSPKKSVSGADRQALSYYNRAANAIKDLETPDSKGSTLEQRMSAQNIAGQYQLQSAPNILKSPDQQAYRQAQRSFTEARLRKESGAAIPPHEYENDAKTYFRQPGDSDEVIAQKLVARQSVLDGLRNAAGPAYEEYFGEPPPTPKNVSRGTGDEIILVRDPVTKKLVRQL